MRNDFCFAKPFPTYFLIFPKAALEGLSLGITGPILQKRGTMPTHRHTTVTGTGVSQLFPTFHAFTMWTR